MKVRVRVSRKLHLPAAASRLVGRLCLACRRLAGHRPCLADRPYLVDRPCPCPADHLVRVKGEGEGEGEGEG